MRQQQSGFTLIEIAIVLVIIGLLLGGVLKGQELITQAKIKNVANDFNGLTAAIYSYQDRYKRLPGDDPGGNRWSEVTLPAAATLGNNKIEGAFNADNAAGTIESRVFWQELRLAGFVAGAGSSLDEPLNAAGGVIGVQDGATAPGAGPDVSALGFSGLIICSGSLPAKIAAAIDAQFDDGNFATGSVRGVLHAGGVPGAGASGTYNDNGTNLYTVCKNL
jgi:prepilin-type N-terminal cleavage/methylation domain-containing protein